MMTAARILSSLNKVDPTCMDDKTSQALFEYLFNSPSIIEKVTCGTKVSLTPFNSSVELTYEIRHRSSSCNHHYDVIGKKLTQNVCYEQYELLGRLIPQPNQTLLFEPFANTLVIDTVVDVANNDNSMSNPNSKPILKQRIDAANLTEEQKKIIGPILIECAAQNQEVFPEGLNCLQVNNAQLGLRCLIYVDFVSPVIFRVSEDDPYGFRFEVQGDKIGKGAFASVFYSNATLKPQKDARVEPKRNESGVIKAKHRVIKDELITTSPDPYSELHGISDIIKAYEMGKLTPHLRVKPPVVLNDHTYSIGKFFAGFGLDSVIQSIWKDKNPPDTDTRLNYMREVLYATKDQIHDRRIVHRDLKKDNIRLSAEGANIIDLGLSKFSWEDDTNQAAGTLIFLAPEAWKQYNSDFKIDVFTLGAMFAYLWGAEDLELSIGTKLQACKAANNREYSELFKNVHDLTESQQSRIEKIIYAMSAGDRKDRASITDAILVVEEIMLERKFSAMKNETENALYEKMRLAHQKANELKQLMTYAPHLAYEILSRRLPEFLQTIDDSPRVIEEFNHVLHVGCLRGIKTKAELISKATSLAETFKHCIKELEARLLQMATLEANAKSAKISRRINHALVYAKQSHITLDDTERLIKKLQKALQKIDEGITDVLTKPTFIPGEAIHSAAMVRLFNLPEKTKQSDSNELKYPFNNSFL